MLAHTLNKMLLVHVLDISWAKSSSIFFPAPPLQLTKKPHLNSSDNLGVNMHSICEMVTNISMVYLLLTSIDLKTVNNSFWLTSFLLPSTSAAVNFCCSVLHLHHQHWQENHTQSIFLSKIFQSSYMVHRLWLMNKRVGILEEGCFCMPYNRFKGRTMLKPIWWFMWS